MCSIASGNQKSSNRCMRLPDLAEPPLGAIQPRPDLAEPPLGSIEPRPDLAEPPKTAI